MRPMIAQRSPRPGAEGGNEEGRAAPTLAGHLVAVQAGDDRGGLPRDVHQDGGGRAAVHGPVVDPGQHDDRARGVDAECRRDEQGDARHGPDAGQDADDRPPETPDEGQVQVLERQRRREPVAEALQHIHKKAAPCLPPWDSVAPRRMLNPPSRQAVQNGPDARRHAKGRVRRTRVRRSERPSGPIRLTTGGPFSTAC